MAEAHSAVAFSFAITHEGFDINYDHEVLNLVWNSGVRSWKKRMARARVGAENHRPLNSILISLLPPAEWHSKWCLSGAHTEPVADHGHCAGSAFCRLSGTF